MQYVYVAIPAPPYIFSFIGICIPHSQANGRDGVASPAGPAKAGPLFRGSLFSFSNCRDSLRMRRLGEVSHASSPLPCSSYFWCSQQYSTISSYFRCSQQYFSISSCFRCSQQYFSAISSYFRCSQQYFSINSCFRCSQQYFSAISSYFRCSQQYSSAISNYFRCSQQYSSTLRCTNWLHAGWSCLFCLSSNWTWSTCCDSGAPSSCHHCTGLYLSEKKMQGER